MSTERRRRGARAALEGYGRDVADAWARATGASRTRTLAARNAWRAWARSAGTACTRGALEAETPVWALDEDAQGLAALRRHAVLGRLKALSQMVEDEATSEQIPTGAIEAWLEALEAAEERAEAALWAAAGGKAQIPKPHERARAAALAREAGTDEGNAWTLSDAAVRALAGLSKAAAAEVGALGGWRTRVVCESAGLHTPEGVTGNQAVHAAIATQGGGKAAVTSDQAEALETSLATWRWETMKPPVRTLWGLATRGRAISDDRGWGAAITLEREPGKDSTEALVRHWAKRRAALLEEMEEAVHANAADRLSATVGGLHDAPRAAVCAALERLDALWRDDARTGAPAHLEADPVGALSMVWVVATDTAPRVLGLSPEGDSSRSARLMRAIRKHAGRKIEAARPEALAAAGPVPRRVGEEAEGAAAAERWRAAMAALKRALAIEGGKG